MLVVKDGIRITCESEKGFPWVLKKVVVDPGKRMPPKTYPDDTITGDNIFIGYEPFYNSILDEILITKETKQKKEEKEIQNYQKNAAQKVIEKINDQN